MTKSFLYWVVAAFLVFFFFFLQAFISISSAIVSRKYDTLLCPTSLFPRFSVVVSGKYDTFHSSAGMLIRFDYKTNSSLYSFFFFFITSFKSSLYKATPAIHCIT